MPEQLLIDYQIECTDLKRALAVAEEIALEQTVETPPSLVEDEFFQKSIIGQVIEAQEFTADSFKVGIAYNPEVTGFQVGQFFNVIFGNISLKKGIRIENIVAPDSILKSFGGPQFGISGVRKILQVHNRPLLATALKPMGKSPEQLADIAHEFALGGGDLIKDDHGLADQPFCPFKDRVSAVMKAISEARESTRRETFYFPNISGHFKTIESQLDFALDHGVKGVLISPFLAGLETVNYIAGNYPLIIMVHPAMSGSLFNDPKQGIAPGVMLGTLFRLIGADISIYPSPGGRFPFTPQDCQSINDALLTPDLQVKKSFPAPAGGLKISTIAQAALEYGRDTLLLIGGDLLESISELAANTRKIIAQFDRLFPEDQESTTADPAFSVFDCHSLRSNKEIVARLRTHLKFSSDFSWQGRDTWDYKNTDGNSFHNVKRIELTGRFGEKTAFDVRYFEVQPKGYTSYETHRHEHVIIGIRGLGTLIIGNRTLDLKVNDIAYIAPHRPHRIKNNTDHPFGFFCIVDHERDRPRVLDWRTSLCV